MNEYDDSPKTCEPQRDSHVRRALNGQEKAINEQKVLISELTKRLGPVLLPVNGESCATGECPKETSVPLAVRIHEGRRCIESNNHAIVSLLKSIEL